MRLFSLGLVLGLTACTLAEPDARPRDQPARPRDQPARPAKRPPPPRPAPALATCATAVHDNAMLDSVDIGADAVALCHGQDAGRTCWSVDLATGAYTPRPVTPVPEPQGAAFQPASVTDDGAIKLCTSAAPTSCTIFTPPVKSELGMGTSTNADHSLVAVLGAEGTRFTIYDVATGKKRTTVKAWKTSMGSPAPFDPPVFAGDRLIAWIHATPVSSAARIFTLAGKKVGDVGPRDFTGGDYLSWRLDDRQWAFKQLDAAKLIVVDLKSAKTRQTFKLGALATHPAVQGEMGALFEVSGIAVRGDQIVYPSADEIPVVALLDRKTGKMKALTAPRCP
jgi:hypothetical protein